MQVSSKKLRISLLHGYFLLLRHLKMEGKKSGFAWTRGNQIKQLPENITSCRPYMKLLMVLTALNSSANMIWHQAIISQNWIKIQDTSPPFQPMYDFITYKRLNFGISSASEVFQEAIRSVIQHMYEANNIYKST